MSGNPACTAFGLTLESELPLPELPACEGRAEVSITLGKAPEHLQNPAQSTPWLEMKAGEFLLTVDSVARYYVEGGRRIVVEPCAGAEDDGIRTFLYDSAFAALLQQNGLCALHGSAVLIGGRAIGILGSSSVGKTAVALSLSERGYPVLADELCAVGVREGRPVVYPGLPRLGVWADTLHAMGKKSESLRPVRRGLQKYAYPLADRFHARPAELSRVFILKNQNRYELLAESVVGGKKLEALLQLEFGAAAAPDPARHFRVCASISALSFLTLQYERTLDRVGAIADRILEGMGA